MQSDLLAPWAEVVPDSNVTTVDQLLALPDDGWMYELVEGKLVRLSPSGGGAPRIGMDIGTATNSFVRARGLGEVTGADGEFVLSKPGEKVTSLAPDVAFVRADRVPPRDSPEYEKPWLLAPDLVVEIASPNQYRPEMKAKALVYLTAGVRLVWIVWPRRRQIDVWRPGGEEPSATLGVNDIQDGLDVLPGFTYPVAKLLA